MFDDPWIYHTSSGWWSVYTPSQEIIHQQRLKRNSEAIQGAIPGTKEHNFMVRSKRLRGWKEWKREEGGCVKGCMRVMCTWGFSYELEDEKVVNFGKRRAHKHTIHIPYIVSVDRSFFTAATHSHPRCIASSTQITIYSNCIFSHSSYTTWHLHLHLHKRHEPPNITIG